jgi:hypothetical protein
MTSQAGTGAGAGFKDRKTGLVLFGILHIVFGGFCALMVPFMILGMIMSSALGSRQGMPPMTMTPQMMIPAVMIYVLAAVWFLSMGIGSIKARRWARALILVVSWIWLISGIIGIVFIAMFMPNIGDQWGRNGQIPAAMAAIMTFVMVVFALVFYIVVPGALVYFYGSRHVKATCEQRDPQIRWTDKCPLPVLAVSVLFGAGACFMPMMGCYGWAMPFFGSIVTGAAGAAVALAAMVVCAYVAWGSYHLRIEAWGAAVMLVILWGVSAGITFSRVPFIEWYANMNYPPEQLAIMKSFMPSQSAMLAVAVLWGGVALGYLIYTRRFFAQTPGVEG